GTDAGSYTHSASGADGNYELTFIDGALIIDPAALTVTADNMRAVYDGAVYDDGFAVTYSGFVGGEDQTVLSGSLVYGGDATTARNAGDYTISASGLSSSNYYIDYVDGTLTVDKAAATVTANSGTMTYNGAVQSITGFTVTGLVGGEDASVLT